MFWFLAGKLLPLYGMIALGWIAGRALHVDARSFSRILLYILVPVVFFDAILKTPLRPLDVALPFIFWGLCSGICIFFYKVVGKNIQGSSRNILAFAAGSANTGYFGLPATLYLMGEASAGRAILTIFGYNLFESSVGFYITARGNCTPRQAFEKVLKLPSLYAFVLAVTLNFYQWKLPVLIQSIADNARAAYSLLGLMIVGIGVAHASRKHWDTKFIALCLASKFLLFPILVGFLIFLDQNNGPFFSKETHQTMQLMSVVPLAANGVAIATELKAQPEKVALAILVSTLLAIFIMPAYVLLFF